MWSPTASIRWPAIVAAAGPGGPARSLPGCGVRGAGHHRRYGVRGGRTGPAARAGGPLPDELREATGRWSARGAVVLYLLRLPATVLGAFALTDEVRPEARQAIAELRAAGVVVALNAQLLRRVRLAPERE
ncbi:hypothetical protein [Micromonospora sp. NPDC049102]|uniref:hypothetical protein n=1 Tax=Micromonospora sp. NPDC049102 TaxID=3364265 RepID=UPI003717B8A5